MKINTNMMVSYLIYCEYNYKFLVKDAEVIKYDKLVILYYCTYTVIVNFLSASDEVQLRIISSS